MEFDGIVEINVDVRIDVLDGATKDQIKELATKEAINIINAGGGIRVYVTE